MSTEKIECSNCLTENFSQFNINSNDNRTFKGNCIKCNKKLKFKLKEGLVDRDSISFSINGLDYTVDNSYPLTMSLNDYLRDVLNLTGTKVMCKEGGCGSCIATAEMFDYTTGQNISCSINTCLFPLYSCDNLKITTIEGIGNKSSGYNEIQKRLVKNNGTQCGYCTPGFVMNMYSLLLNDSTPSKSKIESSFDGNICRCTGYRSILDSMKSFASDEKPIDIEELNKLKCLNNKPICKNKHNLPIDFDKNVHIIKENVEWFVPKTINDLYTLLTQYQNENYRIIASNTAVGVYKNDGPFDTYINIRNIPDLYQIAITPSIITIGSQATLSKLINIFDAVASTSGFEYLSEISSHIKRIGNVSVRNVATWAGNLEMKFQHNDFASDVFILLETINASIKLVGPSITTPAVEVVPSKYLQTSHKGKIIHSMTLKTFEKSKTLIKTYKIMPRSQNSHAYVNAGFNFTFSNTETLEVASCSIVFGGISSKLIHTSQTENFLIKKSLNDDNVLNNAFKILNDELNPDDNPVLSSIEYRKSLALSLFYKFILYANQNTLSPRLKSSFYNLIDQRPISTGVQEFPVNPNTYPVSEPMPKSNALLQTSGEAKYTYDNIKSSELHGAFILSEIGNCWLDKIDTSIAKQMSGVVKIIFANDIPGKNTFTLEGPRYTDPELLFAENKIDYAGQSIGLVIARTYDEALAAARAVKVSYKNLQKPIITINDAIEANSFYDPPVQDFVLGNAENAISSSTHELENDFSMGGQFHFFMENHVAICEPYENYYNIQCSTQHIDHVQGAVAQILAVPNKSYVTVKVDQLGGGFGGKFSRANLVACAAAVASKSVGKSVRVALDMNSQYELIGKRDPWYAKYKVGFDAKGKINGLLINWYADGGNNQLDNLLIVGSSFVDNCYNIPNWKIISKICKTNLAANTFFRAPGILNNIGIIENVIENVAKYINADPVEVKKINMYNKGDIAINGDVLDDFNANILVDNLLSSSEYAKRLDIINQFNRDNRWKKKGISLNPLKWGINWSAGNYNVLISIFASDGSVQLTHGGIEMGQGIHTVAAQVCAYALNIPIKLITVRHTDTFVNPNSRDTGGSITTQLNSKAIIECCKLINQKLDPIRQIMPSGYTWQDLIKKAKSMYVDLCTHYWQYQPNGSNSYRVYGAACAESTVDVLTGEVQIDRIDILYDCGQPLNPEIDIGQAEGAFVQGIGFWLTEQIKYDPKTGRNLTNGTWEYKVPTTKDIPIDFRVSFLKESYNPNVGFLGAKAIGEPPICLSLSAYHSIRRAIEAARNEIGDESSFCNLDAPLTVESVQQACLVNYNQFKLSA